MPNQVAAATRAPGRPPHQSAAADRAPNAVWSSATTKIAASDKYQFSVDQAKPMKRHSIQKISSALPGDGSDFGDEAPAKSVAPNKPTIAARSAPTRRKFKLMSEVRRQVRFEA